MKLWDKIKMWKLFWFFFNCNFQKKKCFNCKWSDFLPSEKYMQGQSKKYNPVEFKCHEKHKWFKIYKIKKKCPYFKSEGGKK